MRIRSLLLALLVVGTLPGRTLALPPPTPVETLPIPSPPTVSAPAWILYDETAGVVLAESAADERRPMASTTKIMTALLGYELGTPGQMVTVSTAADEVGESEIGLVIGERLPLDALVRVLLVRSANDAAVAVAEALGGSVERFVALMNERAEEMGLENTRFANPHGLDAPEHYSSARDLLTLARTAMDIPAFAESVATTRFSIPDAPDGTPRVAETTNQLLGTYPGALGIKTGFTFQAGLVLVAAAERQGRRLYAVVMGSDGAGAHFADATALLDHGFERLGVVDTVMRGTPFPSSPVMTDELARVGAAEALIHVAGLLGDPSRLEPAVEVIDDRPSVVQVIHPERIPGFGDALMWLFGASDG